MQDCTFKSRLGEIAHHTKFYSSTKESFLKKRSFALNLLLWTQYVRNVHSSTIRRSRLTVGILKQAVFFACRSANYRSHIGSTVNCNKGKLLVLFRQYMVKYVLKLSLNIASPILRFWSKENQNTLHSRSKVPSSLGTASWNEARKNILLTFKTRALKTRRSVVDCWLFVVFKLRPDVRLVRQNSCGYTSAGNVLQIIDQLFAVAVVCQTP